MKFDFTGKVAVITGGSAGMGYAAAELFGWSKGCYLCKK